MCMNPAYGYLLKFGVAIAAIALLAVGIMPAWALIA